MNRLASPGKGLTVEKEHPGRSVNWQVSQPDHAGGSLGGLSGRFFAAHRRRCPPRMRGVNLYALAGCGRYHPRQSVEHRFRKAVSGTVGGHRGELPTIRRDIENMTSRSHLHLRNDQLAEPKRSNHIRCQRVEEHGAAKLPDVRAPVEAHRRIINENVDPAKLLEDSADALGAALWSRDVERVRGNEAVVAKTLRGCFCIVQISRGQDDLPPTASQLPAQFKADPSSASCNDRHFVHGCSDRLLNAVVRGPLMQPHNIHCHEGSIPVGGTA
jgi:hypothetical protein